MLLRPRNPADHRQFEEVLPWFTPLFVWHGGGIDWVRWSVPKDMAEKMGIAGGCVCCGKNDRVEGDMGDYHVDTAWHETDWWLETNGYSNPTAPVRMPDNIIGVDVDANPTKEEGTS